MKLVLTIILLAFIVFGYVFLNTRKKKNNEENGGAPIRKRRRSFWR